MKIFNVSGKDKDEVLEKIKAHGPDAHLLSDIGMFTGYKEKNVCRAKLIRYDRGEISGVIDNFYGYSDMTIVKTNGQTMLAKGNGCAIGDICLIEAGKGYYAEVIGFQDEDAVLLPYLEIRENAFRSNVILLPEHRGEVKDLRGTVIDQLNYGDFYLSALRKYGQGKVPVNRTRVGKIFLTGVKAIDGLATLGQGMRISVCSASRRGTQALFGSIARGNNANLNIIVLIGHRGHETGEFIDTHLGAEALKRSVVFSAPAGKSPVFKTRMLANAMNLARHYSAQGLPVCFILDSLTRAAYAYREIAYHANEYIADDGFPVSFWNRLPKIFEQSGTSEQGNITAFYGFDGKSDIIADYAENLTDGSIVLSEKKADRGVFPAIRVLKSHSRMMENLVSTQHLKAAENFRRMFRKDKKQPELQGFIRQDRNKMPAFADIEQELLQKFLPVEDQHEVH